MLYAWLLAATLTTSTCGPGSTRPTSRPDGGPTIALDIGGRAARAAKAGASQIRETAEFADIEKNQDALLKSCAAIFFGA